LEDQESKQGKAGRKTGYRKANAMTGRLALRVPQELVDWLEEQGAPKGLGVGDVARMILLEKMHRAKSKR
jgi:hypothetical protein